MRLHTSLMNLSLAYILPRVQRGGLLRLGLALVGVLLLDGGMSSHSQDEDRVAEARGCVEAVLRDRFRKAGLDYPPKELFLRAFKEEKVIEAWVRKDAGPFHLAWTWPVLAASGELGPKRREGDLQVPEGCYEVTVFNPLSRFHLSLGLNYPNASDVVRSDPDHPGFDIYIHGGGMSAGCLAIGDAGMEELFILATDVRAQGGSAIPVHVFPMRMSGDAWEKLTAEHSQHAAFWAELEPIYAAFERTRRLPAVTIRPDGSYGLPMEK